MKNLLERYTAMINKNIFRKKHLNFVSTQITWAYFLDYKYYFLNYKHYFALKDFSFAIYLQIENK